MAALPPAEYDRLRAGMRPVQVNPGDILNGVRKRVRYAHYPLSGLICLAVPAGSAMVSVGLVGNEGMTGLPMSLGNGKTPMVERVQVSGTALRLPAQVLASENERNSPLAATMRRYTQAFLVMLAQGLACSHAHRIEQRLARWLLMVDDRLGPGEFPLTHQNLAQMLSVRRASVSEVAERFRDRGLIVYSRGFIAVADRAGLERLSCECYGIIRKEYDRLLLARGHSA